MAQNFLEKCDGIVSINVNRNLQTLCKQTETTDRERERETGN